MSDRSRKFNVTQAFTTNFGLNDFNAALFADDSAMFHALVFTAKTFVIFYGTKNFGAEKTIALGFKGTIVNGFWFFYFTDGTIRGSSQAKPSEILTALNDNGSFGLSKKFNRSFKDSPYWLVPFDFRILLILAFLQDVQTRRSSAKTLKFFHQER